MIKRTAMALCLVLALGICPISGAAADEGASDEVTQFMDCMTAMPIIESLSKTCWGAAEVGARDQGNGLEDRTMANYSYWDGGIVKDDVTGKYYMFASRWNQAGGHWGQDGIAGWKGSQAVYSVSDNLYGPYTDMGPIWPDWCEGAGHNVFPFPISKSDTLYSQGYRYCISISDTGMHGATANGTLHIAKSVAGPWELVNNNNSGKLKASGSFGLTNISIAVRADGKYEATNRNGDLAIADSVAGTWSVKVNGLWSKISGLPQGNLEDPVIWYSDGLYHIVLNKWDVRRAFYLTSPDGITGWRMRPGTAYTPTENFLCYTDGTVNNWAKIERPNIYVENGKIAAMTFAVIDVQKESDKGNDTHGSKVIVVPFSSDKLVALDAQPDPMELREGVMPTADATIQSWKTEADKNYGAELFMQLQKDPDYITQNMGAFGEGAEKPEDGYDNKIGFIKFDLSSFDTENIGEATLSLVYQSIASGTAETAKIEVALSDADWKEGTGKESQNSNLAASGDLTWKNQPKLYCDRADSDNTIASSAKFDTSTAAEVKIDVTKLVRSFVKAHPGEKTISFALNTTETGVRFHIGSRDGGKISAPLLSITKNEMAGLLAVQGNRVVVDTQSFEKAVIIMAQYEGKLLKRVDLYDCISDGGKKEYIIPDGECRIMLLESLTSVKPLCSVTVGVYDESAAQVWYSDDQMSNYSQSVAYHSITPKTGQWTAEVDVEIASKGDNAIIIGDNLLGTLTYKTSAAILLFNGENFQIRSGDGAGNYTEVAQTLCPAVVGKKYRIAFSGDVSANKYTVEIKADGEKYQSKEITARTNSDEINTVALVSNGKKTVAGGATYSGYNFTGKDFVVR